MIRTAPKAVATFLKLMGVLHHVAVVKTKTTNSDPTRPTIAGQGWSGPSSVTVLVFGPSR